MGHVFCSTWRSRTTWTPPPRTRSVVRYLPPPTHPCTHTHSSMCLMQKGRSVFAVAREDNKAFLEVRFSCCCWSCRLECTFSPCCRLCAVPPPHTQLWFASFMKTIRDNWSEEHGLQGFSFDQKEALVDPATDGKQRLELLRAIALQYQPNLTLKVVLVGRTGAGKTSFINTLNGGGRVVHAGEAGRTLGVSISVLDVNRGKDATSGVDLPSATAVVFDQGGQWEYLPVQKQLLTSDSIVVVTVSMADLMSTDKTKKAAAWQSMTRWLEALRTSSTVAGAAGGSTSRHFGVVVLATHMDEVRDACVFTWLVAFMSLNECAATGERNHFARRMGTQGCQTRANAAATASHGGEARRS